MVIGASLCICIKCRKVAVKYKHTYCTKKLIIIIIFSLLFQGQ